MAQQTSGHSIEDIYRTVIADVIAQVKEAFLDENIDIDVLQQLKKDWEDKVNQSGCVEMDGNRTLRPPEVHPNHAGQVPQNQKQQWIPNPAARGEPQQQVVMRLQESPESTVQSQNASGATSSFPPQHIASNNGEVNFINSQQLRQQLIRVPVQGQNVPRISQSQGQPVSVNGPQGQQFIVVSQQGQPQLSHAVGNMPRGIPAGAVFTGPGTAMGGNVISQSAHQAQAILPQMASFQLPGGQRVTQVQNGQPFYVTGGPNGLPMYVQNGQAIVMTANPNIRTSNLPNQQNQPMASNSGGRPMDSNPIQQLDGACGDADPDLPASSKSSLVKPRKLNKRQMRKLAEKMSRSLISQLDGGGGGMTDSSSEDDEEEDDPLQNFVNKIDEGEDDAEQVQEEDPLNSEDDQTDDEDLATLFDADNVVMCQFEKVHRARQKWKFHLKDGIMQIQGRDYVFSKCTGEAEW